MNSEKISWKNTIAKVMARQHSELSSENTNTGLQQVVNQTLGILLSIVILGIGYALFTILAPFLRPMLWALLLGFILFPAKSFISTSINSWLTRSRDQNIPLVTALATLPLHLGQSLTDHFTRTFFVNSRLIAVFVCCVVGVYAAYWLSILDAIIVIYGWVTSLFTFLMSRFIARASPWLWALIAAHFLSALFFTDYLAVSLLRMTAVPVWILTIIQVTSCLGYLQVPVFLVFISVSIAAYCNAKRRHAEAQDVTMARLIWQDVKMAFGSFCWTTAKQQDAAEESNPSVKDENPSATGKDMETEQPEDEFHENSEPADTQSFSHTVFFYLFWAYVCLFFLSHPKILVILLLTVALFKAFKFVSQNFYPIALADTVRPLLDNVSGFLHSRRHVLAPKALREILHWVMQGHQVLDWLKGIVDPLVTCGIVLGLVALLVSAPVIVVVKLQQETFFFLRESAALLNQTSFNDGSGEGGMHPILASWLPSNASAMSASVDAALDKAYGAGRDWIDTQIDIRLESLQNDSRIAVKTQLLMLADQLYASWTNQSLTEILSRHTGQHVTHHQLHSPGSRWHKALKLLQWNATKNDENNESYTGGDELVLPSPGDFIKVIRDNYDGLKTVFSSVFHVLRSNASVLMGLSSTVFYALLTSGSTIVNFVFSCVVFLTSLYYLLAASTDSYVPVEWIESLFPGKSGRGSLNKAIQGVFSASAKMGLFHGAWTWLIHSVVGSHMCWLPALASAFFAVIPVIGTYWVAIPGCLDLWLIQGDPLFATALFLLEMAPVYIVDQEFYAEIEGAGHPYVTALSIIGGACCYGLEGAIMGPLLVCCVLVAMHEFQGKEKT